MKVKRNFATVIEGDKKNPFHYINVEIHGLNEDKAHNYLDALCAKMTEMDDVYGCKYAALKCPDFVEFKSEKIYSDMISYEKEVGQIAEQKTYVGKLMTRAIATLR